MDVQEDVVDTFLRYGLFIGAVFQLVCIGAVIIMPDSKSTLFHVSFPKLSKWYILVQVKIVCFFSY